MRDKGIYNMKRAMPRMSWDVQNLYNLFQRTVTGPKKSEITFTRTSKTLFQQRWTCKAVVRAYHGDYIPEKIFKRYYLPETLPDVRPRRAVLSSTGRSASDLEAFAMRKKKEEKYQAEQDRRGMPPVGSLMFSEVERRIDVFVFRACFAHSVYEARRLVLHGDVYLNGKKWQNPNTRLAPGDMIHVNPSAIRFLKGRANSGSAEVPAEAETEASEAAEETQDAAATPTKEAPKESEASAASETATESASETSVSEGEGEKKVELTPFELPPYASPHIFIPAYIEPNFKTCTAVYVRHPTARPGYSEIPTPYDADGEVVRFAWEWYAAVRPRIRSARQLERAPLDRAKILLEDKTHPVAQLKIREKMARLRRA